MPEIAGKLLADLHPNGTVRFVFIAHVGGVNECPSGFAASLGIRIARSISAKLMRWSRAIKTGMKFWCHTRPFARSHIKKSEGLRSMQP